ncbi:MAG: DUF1801 domain-containing protein [Bacteroidia bacterium]
MPIPEVDAFIAASAEPQRSQMQAIRAWLHQLYPQLQESMKWGRPVFSLQKDLAYFKPTKKELTFGFFAAHKVVTRPELLEGTGAAMRHIKIGADGAWDKALVVQWLKEMQQQG